VYEKPAMQRAMSRLIFYQRNAAGGKKRGVNNYSAGSILLSSFVFFMFWARAIIPVVSPSPMVFRTEEGTRIRTELFVLSPSYSIFMPLR
jgi:hypothetical protein